MAIPIISIICATCLIEFAICPVPYARETKTENVSQPVDEKIFKPFETDDRYKSLSAALSRTQQKNDDNVGETQQPTSIPGNQAVSNLEPSTTPGSKPSPSPKQDDETDELQKILAFLSKMLSQNIEHKTQKSTPPLGNPEDSPKPSIPSEDISQSENSQTIVEAETKKDPESTSEKLKLQQPENSGESSPKSTSYDYITLPSPDDASTQTYDPDSFENILASIQKNLSQNNTADKSPESQKPEPTIDNEQRETEKTDDPDSFESILASIRKNLSGNTPTETEPEEPQKLEPTIDNEHSKTEKTDDPDSFESILASIQKNLTGNTPTEIESKEPQKLEPMIDNEHPQPEKTDDPKSIENILASIQKNLSENTEKPQELTSSVPTPETKDLSNVDQQSDQIQESKDPKTLTPQINTPPISDETTSGQTSPIEPTKPLVEHVQQPPETNSSTETTKVENLTYQSPSQSTSEHHYSPTESESHPLTQSQHPTTQPTTGEHQHPPIETKSTNKSSLTYEEDSDDEEPSYFEIFWSTLRETFPNPWAYTTRYRARTQIDY